MSRFFTPAEIAELLGVNHSKVNGWITSGELPATNVATRRGGQARWRVAAEDLETFLQSRRNQAPSSPKRRQRKLPEVKRYV